MMLRNVIELHSLELEAVLAQIKTEKEPRPPSEKRFLGRLQALAAVGIPSISRSEQVLELPLSVYEKLLNL